VSADFDDEVEFLDLDAGAAGGGADEVDWLDEPAGEERVASGRDPRKLPRRAARGRALASVLSLALVLSAAGGIATAAYHRHQTDVRVADALQLAAASTAPSVPDLTKLAFATNWQAYPVEQVVIPVANQGPAAITLVDATLVESDLRGTPVLKPVGRTVIPPGGTGVLAGTVTADCVTVQYSALISTSDDEPRTLDQEAVPADVTSGVVTVNGMSEGIGLLSEQKPASADQLRVRARAYGGRLRVATILPESGQADTAHRICAQQGHNAVRTGKMKISADPSRHTITMSVSATSLADSPVSYSAGAGFSAAPVGADMKVDQLFVSTRTDGPVAADGEAQPGHKFTVTFVTTVGQCPSTPPSSGDEIVVGITYILANEPVGVVVDTLDAGPLISEACGHPADWKND
jgi:hypothetical protein